MRNLKLTDITTGVGMPLKSGSLTHVQLAYKEAFENLTKSVIGNCYDNTKGYVIYGCVNTGSGSSYNISAGAIFYQGEIYLVDATTFTTSGSNVPVCTITTTYYTGTEADQVEFTDSVLRNVHEIRKIVIASGASGSGTVNYANLITNEFVYYDINSTDVTINAGTGTFGSGLFVYRRYMGMVFLTYSIGITPSTYTSGNFGFEILMNNLPAPSKLYTISLVNTDYAALSNFNYSNSPITFIKIGKTTMFTRLAGTTKNIINFLINDTTTSAINISGQIIYKEA